MHWWLVTPPRPSRGGVWLDLCRRNNGTLSNMDPATDWVVGPNRRPGGWGALDFDGTNDRVPMASSITAPTNLTVSAWWNTASITSPDVRHLFADGNSTGNVYWRPQCLNAQKPAYGYGSSSGNSRRWDATNNIVTATGVWWHIVWTQVGTDTPVLYVNGVAQAVTLASSAGTNTRPTAQGAALGSLGLFTAVPGFFWTGFGDDIRLYDRVLSDAEVMELYRNSRGYCTGLLNPVKSRAITIPLGSTQPPRSMHQFRQRRIAV